MDACVKHYAAATGLTLPAAAACASAAASRLLGLEGKKGSLHVGCDADLVVLDEQGQVCTITDSPSSTICTVNASFISTATHHHLHNSPPSALFDLSSSLPLRSLQVLITFVAGEVAWVASGW
jgi:predicted amidohydrolase YtcJ